MSRLVTLFVIPIMFFGVVFAAHAQEEKTIGGNQGTVVSEVGVRNCSLVQNDRSVTIDCDFTNGKGIQPDVRYSVQLIQGTEDDRRIVDESVYPETFQMRENETTHKTISYTIPGFFQGTGELWVFSSNSEGMGLGMNMVGQVSAAAIDGNFEIIAKSCYLTVNGEAGDKKYSLSQGVDLNAGELLVVHCDVTNSGRTSQPLTAQFASFRRNAFGAPVETPKFPYPTFAVSPAETVPVTFLVPLAAEPQAYDAVLSLTTADGKTVSNKVAIHYVIRGISATIQNILLDKDFYKSGEQAVILASWTGSADNHRSSRFGEGSNEQAKTFGITIKDGNGMLCGENIQDVPERRSAQYTQVTFTVPIAKDCYNPVVSAEVIDINGKSLVKKSVGLESSEQPAEVVAEDSGMSLGKILMAIFGVIILLIIGFVGWKMYSSRQRNPIVGPMVFLLLAFGGLLGSAQTIHAATLQDVWDLSGSGGGGGAEPCYDIPELGLYCGGGGFAEIITTTFTVDLNKTTFNPGETIVASGLFKDSLCSDGAHLGAVLSAQNSADGAMQNFSWGFTSENVSQSRNFTAPSTPGTYSITFTGGSSGVGQNAGTAIDLITTGYTPQKTSYTINYTVASACVPNQGSACTSAANACGGTNAGTIQCDGSCNAGPAPADPADNCPADPGYQCPATACLPPQNGVCGADNGLKLFTTPTRLCNYGSPSGVSGTGPWSWSCAGTSGGATVSCAAQLAAPLPTVSLTINGSTNPPPVVRNSNLNLVWSSTNASSCSGSGLGWATTNFSGTQTILAAGNSTYTLTCFNVDGAFAGASVPVRVIPTSSFEVRVNGGAWGTTVGSQIDTNDTVQVRWSSTDANTCTGTNFNTSNATSNGGMNVTSPLPGQTTTYTLSCTGSGGSVSKSISVTAGLPNFNRPIATHSLSTTFDPATGEYSYVDISFQTTNDGQSGTANTAQYSVQFDSRAALTGSMPLVARGASPNFTQRITTIPFGNHSATIVVDSSSNVQETNEGDNTYVYNFGGIIPPPNPGLNITADKIQLRNNETTTIRWTTVGTYPTLSCTVVGPGMNVSPAPLSGNQTTQPITAKSEYIFTCTETTTNTTWSDSVMVETQGVIQEI